MVVDFVANHVKRHVPVSYEYFLYSISVFSAFRIQDLKRLLLRIKKIKKIFTRLIEQNYSLKEKLYAADFIGLVFSLTFSCSKYPRYLTTSGRFRHILIPNSAPMGARNVWCSTNLFAIFLQICLFNELSSSYIVSEKKSAKKNAKILPFIFYLTEFAHLRN